MFSRLHLDIGQDNFLVRNGDTIKYYLTLDNVGADACDISKITTKLQFPGTNGLPSPTFQTIKDNESYVAQSPSVTFGPFSYTVNVNPGVTEISARTSINGGILHDGLNSPINTDKQIGGKVFQPSITIDKVGSMVGPAPAPQDVVYTFYVRNGSNPALDPAVTALSNVTVSDDKCGSPVYQTGDANANHKLETTETWAFQCTMTHPAAGEYTNTAVANGENILYGRSVPVVSPPDKWTVVLVAPPAVVPGPPVDAAPPVPPAQQVAVKPVAVNQAPCAMSRVNSTTVRAGQLNTIRVHVKNVATGSTVKLTLPGSKKAVTAKTDKNGIATFRVRPTKTGTAKIEAAECSDVEKLSVKPARRVVSQTRPQVTG